MLGPTWVGQYLTDPLCYDVRMTSEKFAQLVTMMAPFDSSELTRIPDYEAWRWIHAQDSPALLSPPIPAPRVCFTRFTRSEKNDVRKVAELAGFKVAKSVGKRLDYLCLGRKPGRGKLARARTCQVRIVDLEAFYAAASQHCRLLKGDAERKKVPV